jgi:hypothetical protein
MSPVLILAAIAAALVLVYVISKADAWMPVTVLGLSGAACYYGVSSWLRKTPAAARPPAPKIVTHVITHVVTRPGKPTLTGGEITLLLIVGGVLALAYLINRTRRSS